MTFSISSLTRVFNPATVMGALRWLMSDSEEARPQDSRRPIRRRRTMNG